MEILKYNEVTHYPMLCNWFAYYGWPNCEKESIGKNAYVVYKDNNPVAFSFFLTTDANFAIMGFTIANPVVDKEIRNEALDKLSKHIISEVERLGNSYFFYFADKNPMVDRMAKNGMTITDNGDAFILMKAYRGKDLKFWAE
jgi:hypothetical protein